MIEKLMGVVQEKSEEVYESLKHFLGVDDELKTRKDYENSMETDSLGALLPFLGWHDEAELFMLDSGEQPIKNKKNNSISKPFLGFCLETNPQTGANEAMESILQSLFFQVPAGTSISFHLYASPDFMAPLKKMAMSRYNDKDLGIKKDNPSLKRNQNIYQTMARKSIDFLLNGSSSPLFPNTHNILIRDFRLIISVTTNLHPKNESDVKKAILLKDQVSSTLGSAGFPVCSWKPADLINFVADFLDHSRIFHVPSKLNIDYDPYTKIRKQITSRENEYMVGKNGIMVSNSMSQEDTVITQLSVSRYPKSFHLAEMSAMIGDFFQSSLSYPCPFLITTAAVVQDYDSMRHKATLKTATSVRKTEGYMAKLDPLLIEEATEWKHALASIEDGGTLIKMFTHITLFSKKKEAEKTKSEVMAVWRSKGFRLSDDRYQQLVSFLSSLPMSLTKPMISDLEKMHRFSTKFSQNAISMAPLIAEWKGTKTPTITMTGRRGQLVSFDFFDNKAGNFNFAIVGASGSGKTFVTQEVLLAYRAIGAKVWVIDVGRGYENVCKMLGGDFIEFTEESNIIINPFTHVQDIDDEMDMLKPLISEMMSPGVFLTSWENSTLEKAILKVFNQLGQKMTLSDLAEELLKKDEEDKLEKRRTDMGVMLFPWTREGAYGKFFDGEANLRFNNDFTVLELEELKGKKHLQSVVLMIMMYRISQEMYLTRDRKKVVLVDEAWDLMRSESSAEFIETGYRRARKYGGAFGTATQSYEDYKGGAAAALKNADWTFTLRQKEESIIEMEQKNILNLGSNSYRKRVIKDLKMVERMYSEIFVDSPSGSGVVRFMADPFKQILFSSSQEHFKSVQTYKKLGHSVVEAIEMTMHDFGVKGVEPIKYGAKDDR